MFSMKSAVNMQPHGGEVLREPWFQFLGKSQECLT